MPEQPKTVTTVFAGNVMTMDYKIIIGAPLTAAGKQKARFIIDDVFTEIDAIYNKWNPESELSILNRMQSGEQRQISDKLQHLLEITERIVVLTEGRFDPTIEPIQKLWKASLEKGEEPSSEELLTLLPAIGWDKVNFANGIFSKKHNLTSIDLGGVAKGYGVDLLAERLHNAGFSHLFVEWGGEIRAIGNHPDNRPWQVVVSGFEETQFQLPLGQITLHDNAVATSGDYFQKWSITKQRKPVTYFHIIDPRTGRPKIIQEHSIASVSVVAPTCALADGLATAAMLFDTPEEAQEWMAHVQTIEKNINMHLFTR